MAEPNELITWLGVKLKPDAKKNIDEVHKGIETIKSGVKKLNNFFFGTAGAVDYFKKTIMGGSQEIENLSKTTGVSIENLQRWKFAAEASGQSFKSITGDLEKFKKTGIDAVAISGKLAGMSQKTAMQWKDRLGLSDEMFNILRQGPKTVKALLSEAPVIPEEKIRDSAKAHREMQEVLAKIEVLKNEVMMELAPLILSALQLINEFISKNGEWIKSNIKPIVYGLLALFAGKKLIGGLTAVISVLKMLKSSLSLTVSAVKTLLGFVISAAKAASTAAGTAANAASTAAGTAGTAATGSATGAATGKVAAGLGVKLAGGAAMWLGSDFVISALTGEKNIVEKVTESALEKMGVKRGGFREYLEKNYAEGGWVSSFIKFASGESDEVINKDRLQYQKKYGINNTTNNSTSIYLQMPYEQAVGFTKDISGGAINAELMAMSPGGFGGNFQP